MQICLEKKHYRSLNKEFSIGAFAQLRGCQGAFLVMLKPPFKMHIRRPINILLWGTINYQYCLEVAKVHIFSTCVQYIIIKHN